MKKFRYATIGIGATVASGILLLGSLFVFLSDANKTVLFTQSEQGGNAFFSYVFLLGLALVLVASIYQLVYFFFQEKKRALLMVAICSIIAFLLYMFGYLGTLAHVDLSQQVFSMMSQPLASTNNATVIFWFSFLIALISFLMNGAVLLQMHHILSLAWLAPMVPTARKKAETKTVEKKKEEASEHEENI